MDRTSRPTAPTPPIAATPARAHPRYDVDWRVSLTCAHWRDAERVVASNASRGGVFLVTLRPPPLGTHLELVISLPDGTDLPLRGRVAHVVTPEQALARNRQAGIGVKFDSVHTGDLLLLEQLAQSGREDLPPAPDRMAGRVVARLNAPSAIGTAPGTIALGGGRVAAGDEAFAEPPTQTTARAQLATPRQAPPIILGLDFGDAFTRGAVAHGDRVELVTDAGGRSALPSAVHCSADGTLTAGWLARAARYADARATAIGWKRLLGRTLVDPTVTATLASLDWPTTSGAHHEVAMSTALGARQLSELTGALFSEIRRHAEAQAGGRVTHALLTVPSGAPAAMSRALLEAAAHAQLRVADLVSEPVAQAWGAIQQGVLPAAASALVGVLDLGGGGARFTVLDVNGRAIRELGYDVDVATGGRALDHALAAAVADAFGALAGVELRAHPGAWPRLVDACEAAKIELSRTGEASLHLEGLVTRPQRIDLHQAVPRQLLDRLTAPWLERIDRLCRGLLHHVGLEPRELTDVLVVGGGASVAVLDEGLAPLFEGHLRRLPAPDALGAIGAARLGAVTMGRTAAVPA